MNLRKKIKIDKYINENITTIYLHVGFMKTATSSIEQSLAASKKYLESIGYFTFEEWQSNLSPPIFSLFSRNPKRSINHINAQRNFREIDEYNRESLKKILKEIYNTSCDKIILSSDWITALLSAKEIKNLKKFLNKVMPNGKIKVIVCTRERRSFVSSITQQHIKSNYVNKNIFDTKYNKLYINSMNKLIKVFGIETIHAYKFEDALNHENGPVGCFAQAIGIEKGNVKNMETVKVNESVSDKAIEIIKYINIQLPYIKNNRINIGRSPYDTQPLQSIQGNKFEVDTKILNKICKKSKKDTRWLEKNFNISYTCSVDNSSKNSEKAYDEQYIEDIKRVYPELSPLLKKLVYDFMSKKKDESKDKESIVVFEIIETCTCISHNLQC